MPDLIPALLVVESLIVDRILVLEDCIKGGQFLCIPTLALAGALVMHDRHSIHRLSDGVQAALSRSQPGTLGCCRPRNASQTLGLVAGLLWIHRPAMDGGHHQGLRIEPVGRLSDGVRSGPTAPTAALI